MRNFTYTYYEKYFVVGISRKPSPLLASLELSTGNCPFYGNFSTNRGGSNSRARPSDGLRKPHETPNNRSRFALSSNPRLLKVRAWSGPFYLCKCQRRAVPGLDPFTLRMISIVSCSGGPSPIKSRSLRKLSRFYAKGRPGCACGRGGPARHACWRPWQAGCWFFRGRIYPAPTLTQPDRPLRQQGLDLRSKFDRRQAGTPARQVSRWPGYGQRQRGI